MNISKKEISIFIEIVFGILFAIFFLPYFYDNRFEIYDFDTSIIKLVKIIVFSIIYFSLTYTLLEIFIRKKAKTIYITKGPALFSFIFCSNSMASIFN